MTGPCSCVHCAQIALILPPAATLATRSADVPCSFISSGKAVRGLSTYSVAHHLSVGDAHCRIVVGPLALNGLGRRSWRETSVSWARFSL
jgi:hypothetical protein